MKDLQTPPRPSQIEGGGSAAPWRGVKYVTSRDSLIALCGSLELPVNANVRALFEALPERPRDYQLQTQSK